MVMTEHGCVRPGGPATSGPRGATVLVSLLLSLLLWITLDRPATAAPIEIRLSPVPLNDKDLAEVRVGELEFLAGFVLHARNPLFGGLSGLVLADEGRRFIAISDRGHWLSGQLRLAADGRLTGLDRTRLEPLRDLKGKQVLIRDGLHDAEAVERLPDGSLLVGFERRHRLWRYPDTTDLATARAEPFLDIKAFGRPPLNGGVEALAPLADGSVLLLTEELFVESGDLRGWLWRKGRALPLRYATLGPFKPTDLAVLPGGDLLVLERRYSPLGGAGARLVRIARDEVFPGARLEGREIASIAWPLTVDNFEALAVAPAPGGGSLVYLLSDDNFSPLQDTILLQFRLAE